MPEDRPSQTLAFTAIQGQYLAFLYAYTQLNRRPPVERDFQDYFQVTAPLALLRMPQALSGTFRWAGDRLAPERQILTVARRVAAVLQMTVK